MARGETREEFNARKAVETKPRPSLEQPAPDLEVKKPAEVDYFCGLRKVAPNSYVVVTGRLVDGKPDLKVDTIAQPLDHAALSLSMKLRTMIGEIP